MRIRLGLIQREPTGILKLPEAVLTYHREALTVSLWDACDTLNAVTVRLLP